MEVWVRMGVGVALHNLNNVLFSAAFLFSTLS